MRGSRVAAFNGLIRGSELAVTMRRLLCDYASMAGRDVIFVENAATGEIISPLVLFGHRTVEQMRLAYPDISVDGSKRLLFDTLFPLLASFIFPSY